MEESREIKIKKFFRSFFKIINNILVTLIVIIFLVFLFFIIHTAVSKKRGTYPKVGLYTIISPSMEPNIKMYDVVLVIKSNNLKVNDIITFYSTTLYKNTPVTHRIVNINDDGTYIVKGDANSEVDSENVLPENIIGKVVLKIPQAGKIQFFIASKWGFLIAILIPILIFVIYDIFKLIKIIKYKKRLKSIENKHGNI